MRSSAASLLALVTLLSASGAAQPPEEAAPPGELPAKRHQHHRHPAHGAEPAGEERASRHEGPVQHSFADAEAWAARFESAERDAWQKPDEVVAALGLEAGMTVADIGSGTGYFARRFATAVGPTGTVYAADVEPGMAVYVRRRADEDGQANLIPVLASYDDPRLPDGAIDLVFICNTWHHIGDRVAYARRLADDLAPGARVVIVDFLPGELPVGPGPEHKLSAAEVTAELVAAGYRPDAAPELLPYQYLLVFKAPAAKALEITLANGSEPERRAREQLERLLTSYDIERWMFTREVVIDESEKIPHSHPILTLNAESLDNDLAQLATLVHEQLHWHVLEDQERLGRAIAAFRELFPEAPDGHPGARNRRSTWLHLVVCDLELQAMTALVGEEEAHKVLAGWGHYPWVYEQVLTNPEVRRTNERLGMVMP